jgi:D-alanine-D-alanine ligase
VFVGGAGVTWLRKYELRADFAQHDAGAIVALLGELFFAKPSSDWHSVGLAFKGADELRDWLARPRRGAWLLEKRICGHELTCGLLGGAAMGIVEIAPASGVYDYASKYTPGSTNYLYPAPIPEQSAAQVRRYSELAFAACGCRDFARADFILPESGAPVFLEINTLPGMTATSLLPKSASCIGLTFEQYFVARMLAPALERSPPPAIV